MNPVVVSHVPNGKSYSALQPFSYIVVDATPYAPWVRMDFDHAWLPPGALANSALTYLLDQYASSSITDDWEEQRFIDHALASILGDVDSSFFSGNNFAPHPYELFAANEGLGSHSLNPLSFPSNAPGISAGYRRIPIDLDPAADATTAAVPEPSTATLFAGLGAILVILGCFRTVQPAAKVE